jgi:hypothetical protein
MEKILLVQSHNQLTSQLEEKIRREVEVRMAHEEKIKQMARKHREKEDKLKKKIEAAEQMLVLLNLLLFVN